MTQTHNTLILFSSSKSISIAERIKKNLDNVFIVTIWNQGFFDNSNLPPVWTFLKNLICYDFAAIVLGADDIMELPEMRSHGKNKNSSQKIYVPKDNVIFELGAVMARIGPQKTFIFKPREPQIKIPSYFDSPDNSKIKEGSDIEKITNFVEYNHQNDEESIDQACNIILKKFEQMKKREKFHSDLPSHGLAHGYIDNFLFPVCSKLLPDKNENGNCLLVSKNNENNQMIWQPAYGFSVTILIPPRIINGNEVISELEQVIGCKPESLSIVKEDFNGQSRPSGIFALPRKNQESPLHILDIPTTLRTSLKVIDQIDEYWLKDNSEGFISKLQERELLNFSRALEQICAENEVINKVKIYIRPLDRLSEHLDYLLCKTIL